MQLTYELLCQLEEEHGDSFYLVDLTHFQRNYTEFLSAFRAHYPPTAIAYSYKTNYLPRLCQIIKQLGGYAEVVSPMEYNLACQIGVNPQQIIFNGPYKRLSDLEPILLAGTLVNIDSWYEVEMIEAMAHRYPHQNLRVGVRCNFEIGAGAISRFGFDVSDPDFALLFRRLRALKNCTLEGLHCHFLVPQKQPVYYARMAQAMIELASRYFSDQPLRFLDLGGGFFSKMRPELRSEFDYPIPTFQEYADAIATPIAEHFLGNGQPPPQLILEPGIALVADVVRFVAKVSEVKHIRQRRIAITSGSIYNIKPTLSTRNLPIEVLHPPNQAAAFVDDWPIDITGYTCMENDCLYYGYRGALARGDFVLFDNVGAYTNVLKPPFINPSPPMLAVTELDGKFELVKRREEGRDIFATYVY